MFNRADAAEQAVTVEGELAHRIRQTAHLDLGVEPAAGRGGGLRRFACRRGGADEGKAPRAYFAVSGEESGRNRG